MDPSSELFISYAETLEFELKIIMARSPEVNSIDIKVTRFIPLASSISSNDSTVRKRRQIINKAVAEFEIFILTGENTIAANVQDSLESQVMAASLEGLTSLDMDILSFQTFIPFDTHSELNNSTCPNGNEWLQIDQSEAGIWSWMASISIGRRASAGIFTCSGTIITDKWILTAADCCQGSIVDEMEVYTSSMEFRQGKMHRVKSYQTADEMCIIRLTDYIDIDGILTSTSCFSSDEIIETDCWIAAWEQSSNAQNHENMIKSVSLQLDQQLKAVHTKCHTDNSIDFTGSPIMCTENGTAVVSGIIWEDKGRNKMSILYVCMLLFLVI